MTAAVSSGLRTLDYGLLQQCMHCGMCLPTCPTYVTTLRERNSPRGRIAWMRAIADRELEVSTAFADEMSYCLGCLACQTACPAGVQYGRLFEVARHDIEVSGVAATPSRRWWRTLTLRLLFFSPRRLRLAGRLLRWYQASGAEQLARRVGLTRLLPGSLRRLEPQTPPMARQFSNALIAPTEQPRSDAKYRVALLTGCIQDLVFPDINRDTADVLLANGCVVDTPASQGCCGSLHAHNGEHAMAQQLARTLIDQFPPDRYDAIISNAGGCGSHLRQFGLLLQDDGAYAERARAWDTKLRDVHEWLDGIGCRVPARGPFDAPATITYHDSCHLAHGQRVTKPPRSILNLLPDITVRELAESTWCCGSAGVYAITQPDQADLLLQRKVKHIAATGASLVATANPGCQLQIARGLRETGAAVRVTHPVSLLALAYRRSAFI